jgi:hypothetical protein
MIHIFKCLNIKALYKFDFYCLLLKFPAYKFEFFFLMFAYGVSCRWHVKMPDIIAKSISILSDAGLGMAMFSLGQYKQKCFFFFFFNHRFTVLETKFNPTLAFFTIKNLFMILCPSQFHY